MKSKNRQRLFGIDLLRGIAAYAVVFVHSGEESLGLPISQAAISLRLLCYFAVPFFLATSFYFLTARSEIDVSRQFWRSRIERILIPYAIWTVIYLIFRSIFLFQSHKIDLLRELLGDPLSIFFFGGASYHLYFLPLLFTGTLLITIAKYLQNIHSKRIFIGCLAILSLIAYEWLMKSGNAFQLYPNTAFQNLIKTAGLNTTNLPLLRFLLVQIAWSIVCLPYLFIGTLLVPIFDRVAKSNGYYRLITIVLCAIGFLLFSDPASIGIPAILNDVGRAYTLLLFAIAISSYLTKGWIFQNVATCSFGIYLIHPFAMLIVKRTFAKILPILSSEVSIVSMLAISIGSFVISWIAIAVMMRSKWLSKYALGI
jgi:peptidoglycan/LPS O-acetylase OafA/YrhL